MREWITQFPESLILNPGTAMDDAIRAFSRNHRETLGMIKTATVWMLTAIVAFIGKNDNLGF